MNFMYVSIILSLLGLFSCLCNLCLGELQWKRTAELTVFNAKCNDGYYCAIFGKQCAAAVPTHYWPCEEKHRARGVYCFIVIGIILILCLA